MNCLHEAEHGQTPRVLRIKTWVCRRIFNCRIFAQINSKGKKKKEVVVAACYKRVENSSRVIYCLASIQINDKKRQRPIYILHQTAPMLANVERMATMQRMANKLITT